MYMFQERFRNEGGKFFDAASMKAAINSDVGVKVLTEMRAENKFMPPGVEQWGFVENLAAFMSGQTAMTISWPPYGRWAAGYGMDEKALSWVPKSTIAGKVGYAMPPGGHPELAAGFALSVASTSKNKDAAYLFIQWLNSEDISLQRVKLPTALRDPFRESHFTDAGYLALWPDAKDYLGCKPTSMKKFFVNRSASYGQVMTRRRSLMPQPPSGMLSPRKSVLTSRRPFMPTGHQNPALIRNKNLV